MEAGVSAGPPFLLECAVRRLIPPMVREEVAGDLWERFRSPGRYLAEATTTLPFLILSQAKRATNGPLFALQAFTIFASFGGFEPSATTVTMWQRALVATLPALAALLLRNAYRASERWTARRAVGDLAAMLFAVLAVQGVVTLLASRGLIDPYWGISGGFLIGGLLFSTTIVFVLRAGADLAPRTRLSMAQRLEEVELDYQLFRRNLRFKNAAEVGALCLLIAVVSLFSLNAKIPLVAAVGFTWVAMTLSATIHRLLRAHISPMPSLLDPAAQLAFYRSELARQRDDIDLAWWLCFGPLFAGLDLNMIVRGLMNGWYGLGFGGVVCIVVLAFMIAQASRARRRQLGEKIASLDRVERLRSG